MIDLESYVKEYLPKIKFAGIETNSDEETVLKALKGFPENMLGDFDEEGLMDFLLMCIQAEDSFMTDFEGLTSDTYLDKIKELSKSTVTFEDYKYSIDPEVEESGQGEALVSFKFRGKPYEFRETVNYDWFDPRFMSFINSVLEENGVEERMIAYGGPNVCMLTFKKPEWTEKVKSVLHIEADVV